MRLIERYLFRQLLLPTLAGAAALGAVALLSQTLSTLDVVVDQRQSLLVFAKIILLTMPQLLAMVLPIAVFVAGLMALNRLHTEQEIVVCFAAGLSRWRVMAPAMRLAALAALVTLAVNLWVQPWCARQLREELFKIRTDLAATLIRPGEFVQASQGLTVYAQRIDQDGLLRNVFIYQEQPAEQGGSRTFTARRGFITRRNGQPALILRQGSNEEFNKAGVLNYLAFDEYVFDLAPYLNTVDDVHYKVADRYLHELVFPDLTQPWERYNRKQMLAEANYRLASPLYNLTFMVLALWAVIGGPFSRLGYGRRVARAALAAAVVRIVGFGTQAGCDSSVALNVVQYAVPIIPAVVAWMALFRQKVGGTTELRAVGGGLTELAGARS